MSATTQTDEDLAARLRKAEILLDQARVWLKLRARIDRVVQETNSIELLLDRVMDALLATKPLRLRPEVGAFLVGPEGGSEIRMGTVRGNPERASVQRRAAAVTAFLDARNNPLMGGYDPSRDVMDPPDGHFIIPLAAGSVTIGALSLVPTKSRGWGRRWYKMLESFGAQIGMAVRRILVDEENVRIQREMEDTRNEALEANRIKSEFLANMSHELRTPLNAIIGYAELLKEDAEDVGEEAMVADLGKIRSAGHHLLQLINTVLDLSKVEAGKVVLDMRDFSVHDLCRDVAHTVHPLVGQKNNSFELDVPDEVGGMHADDTKLRQVLLNLLSNATKFTENGLIALRVRVDEGWMIFDVVDDGIGMTPEQCDRIFVAFQQADASTTRKYGGTGLGLTVSRQFCELMGGTLTVRSEAGKGSTFTVRLPVHVDQDAANADLPQMMRPLVE